MRTFCALLLPAALLLAPAAPPGARAADASKKNPADDLEKGFRHLRYGRFYRHGTSVFESVMHYAQMDESRMSPGDRFLRAYYEGRWDEVRTTLEQLPPDLSLAIYHKILEDLTGRMAPILTLDDFLGLVDACPAELDGERIRRLGQLLRIAVVKEQELWLKRALEKGTRRLGPDGPKKLTTGRLLLHADFAELARQYLPAAADVDQVEDPAVREEIMKFLASQEQLEEFQQTRVAGIWKQQVKVLCDAKADSGAKEQATKRLIDLFGRAPIASIEPWIGELMRDDPGAGLRLASMLGRSAQGKAFDSDVALRASNLKIQKCMLLRASQHANLAQAPWNQVAMAMADWWAREAEHTFQQRAPDSTAKTARPYVAAEEILDAAPDGPWLKALAPSLRERIDVCLSKAVLVSDRYQEAVAMIAGIAGRNPGAGVALAEEYLKAWASRHNPQIPEDVRKRHQLPDDARIVVTPIMMEKNIDSLAQMMDIFRKHGIHPQNATLLVDAFRVCYSEAEVYRRTHVEKVFGPVDGMQEEVFFGMIRTMTEGLSSRWRKTELQKESGTRRTQEETLAMVREGYEAAVDMIEQRSKKHPDGWRSLALAGSLLSDWGDFEYYQELVAETKAKRVEAFRTKNNLAETYFTRAAEAYARLVPKLGRSAYTIEVYLAWFHSLLGINTGGDLNLSKPLDRRALNKIHELLRALPGDAGRAHIDKLARHVSARMQDKEHPLHEDLKYRYLAGSLVITRESPFSFQANSKVSYYDELLKEIRLETRVDGPTTVQRDQPFGIILAVRHSEAIGRMADFGKYLVNDTPVFVPTWKKQPTPLIKVHKMREVRGRRDELELNIREALGLFFDIQSITFSPREVQPRPTQQPGWKETVLAYIHTKAKDSSVDKIPRVQMNLDFLDITGPISISAESPETMIKVSDKKTPPRPFHRVDLTEVLDARNLLDTEEALLEITATANGLVPELEDLIDKEALARQVPIARIDPHEGTLVKEIQSWGDTVHAVSHRQWTIVLDGSALVKTPRKITLQLPQPKTAGAAAKYRTYVDMDLVDLAEPAAAIGIGETAADDHETSERAIAPWVPYAAAAGAIAVLLLAGLVIVRLVHGRGERPLRARDVFRMPPRLDGFVVVQLLRSLGSSHLVRLSDTQRREMRQEIGRIQKACFDGNGSTLSEDELRSVARKWLRVAR